MAFEMLDVLCTVIENGHLGTWHLNCCRHRLSAPVDLFVRGGTGCEGTNASCEDHDRSCGGGCNFHTVDSSGDVLATNRSA